MLLLCMRWYLTGGSGAVINGECGSIEVARVRLGETEVMQ